MKVLKWFWRNNEIIGYLDEKGNEVKINLKMLRDTELHELYHEEIKKGGQNGRNNEIVRMDNGE